jgi:hypothetical protein
LKIGEVVDLEEGKKTKVKICEKITPTARRTPFKKMAAMWAKLSVKRRTGLKLGEVVAHVKLKVTNKKFDKSFTPAACGAPFCKFRIYVISWV